MLGIRDFQVSSLVREVGNCHERFLNRSEIHVLSRYHRVREADLHRKNASPDDDLRVPFQGALA